MRRYAKAAKKEAKEALAAAEMETGDGGEEKTGGDAEEE